MLVDLHIIDSYTVLGTVVTSRWQVPLDCRRPNQWAVCKLVDCTSFSSCHYCGLSPWTL